MLKKKIIFYILFILFFIVMLVLSFFSVKTLINNRYSLKCAEKICKFDSSSPFSINKIVFFSSCDADLNINPNSSFTINNLYQYTDIAIFINNTDSNFNEKNTLKEVSLTNIKCTTNSYGTPNLYFKNIQDFASNNFLEENKISDSITFETSSEDEIDFSKPILFNNCANPITLCFVNSNIINNYTLQNSISNISHNGSLLKNCGITLNSILSSISFLITIKNNNNEIYTCPLSLNIPLSTKDNSIYDGSLILNSITNYNFIKQQ